MKSLYEKSNGNYVDVGYFQISAIVSVDINCEIEFWVQRHKDCLKEKHGVIYYNLLTQGKIG